MPLDTLKSKSKEFLLSSLESAKLQIQICADLNKHADKWADNPWQINFPAPKQNQEEYTIREAKVSRLRLWSYYNIIDIVGGI